jgi:predicted metal-dependent hydrolase
MDELLKSGINLFNNRQFFACHELLEAAWTPERGPRRAFLQSLIHLAVGCYHSQRGNHVGAVRQLRKGLRKLEGYLPLCEGIDTARLYREGSLPLINTGITGMYLLQQFNLRSKVASDNRTRSGG